jgi:hypothetical protein
MSLFRRKFIYINCQHAWLDRNTQMLRPLNINISLSIKRTYDFWLCTDIRVWWQINTETCNKVQAVSKNINLLLTENKTYSYNI